MADFTTILSIADIIIFIFSLGISLRIFITTKFISHFWLSLGFFIFLISRSSKLITSFDTSIFVNFTLVLGFLLVIYGFIFFHHNELPFYSNIISLIAGMAMVSFMNEKWITRSENNVTFGPVPLIFTGIMILIAFIEIFRPLFVKLKYVKTPQFQAHLSLMIISIFFLIIWAVLILWGNPPIRPLFFSLGWLIFAISMRFNPLSLGFVDSTPYLLMISTASGLPVYTYHFKQDKTLEDALVSGILSGLQLALDEILAGSSDYGIIARDNKQVIVQKRDNLVIFLIVSSTAHSIISAMRIFFDKFLKDLKEDISEHLPLQIESDSADQLIVEIFGHLFIKNN